MHITRDDASGTWKFTPVTADEVVFVELIQVYNQPGVPIHYMGRRDDASFPNHVNCKFNVGGEGEWVTTPTPEGGSWTEFCWNGGVTFWLEGSTESDRDELDSLRDTMYFGSSGLMLVEAEVSGETLSLFFTASKCQHCEARLIKMGECEWKTCAECRSKCQHDWKEGAIHGGDAGELAHGEFCAKCGIVNPDRERMYDALTEFSAALDPDS